MQTNETKSDSVPEISLIICTRNRASTLPNCLAALERLRSSFPFEVILVDNGSTDSTPALLAEFSAKVNYPVILVQEPKAGLSRAQNKGIKSARGNVIAFSDDDCYPAPEYLSAIKLGFQDAAIDFIGGRVLLFDPKDLPITIQTLGHRVALPAGRYIKMGLIHGANFAFRRSVINLVSGFDVRLGSGSPPGAANDIDLLQRVSIAGFSGVYDPGPTVYHHHRRKTKQDETRLWRSYAVGRGAYMLKGLLGANSRNVFLWPVCRHLAGHFAYLRFTEFFHEVRGALIYWRTRNSA